MTRAPEHNTAAPGPNCEMVCVARSLSLAAQALRNLLDYAHETDEPHPAVVDAADELEAVIELLHGARK
ncbi:hypothetical protein [Agrilutibacter niabensis]|uniref:hypothetical protein n=1 Tax=Agrilutibacter niabensis TaxID=380628 RepID=UPI00286A2DE0|nr:hypothetical protein [Lysobacter niabensis]